MRYMRARPLALLPRYSIMTLRAVGKSLPRCEFAAKNVNVTLVDFLLKIIQFGITVIFTNIDVP